MDAHPKFHEVASVCKLAPQRTRALFQAYLDIKYEQMMQHVEAHMLDGVGFPAVTAQGAGGRQVFVPVYADEDLSVAVLAAIVEHSAVLAAATAGANSGSNHSTVHLAVVDSDSTVAYYTVGDGAASLAKALIAS